MNSERYERIMAITRQEKPDRIPWSIWGHFPATNWLNQYSWELAQRNGKHAAKAHIALLRELDYKMDLLKVTPFYRFMAIQWGSKFNFQNNQENAPTLDTIVKKTEDWKKLWVLDPKKELKEYIRTNQILARELKTTPTIYTIPSPIIQAMNGIGTPERVLKDIKNNPDTLKQGLDTITQTTIDFTKACIDTGIQGIFYGIGGGGKIWNQLTTQELNTYAYEYDKKILNAVDCDIKLLHICSTEEGNPKKLMESGWFKKYPVNIINWDAHHYTWLDKAKKIYGDKFGICGGLDRSYNSLRSGNIKQIETDVKKAINDAGENGGFMLGPGCTVYQDQPRTSYNAVGRTVIKNGYI